MLFFLPANKHAAANTSFLRLQQPLKLSPRSVFVCELSKHRLQVLYQDMDWPEYGQKHTHRRKWVSERKAEKDNMIDFDQNTYCTIHEADRELERYCEDFAIGEEPTWWVMGSSKTDSRSRRRAPGKGNKPSPPAGSFKRGVVRKRRRQDRQRDHRLHIPHELRW